MQRNITVIQTLRTDYSAKVSIDYFIKLKKAFTKIRQKKSNKSKLSSAEKRLLTISNDIYDLSFSALKNCSLEQAQNERKQLIKKYFFTLNEEVLNRVELQLQQLVETLIKAYGNNSGVPQKVLLKNYLFQKINQVKKDPNEDVMKRDEFKRTIIKLKRKVEENSIIGSNKEEDPHQIDTEYTNLTRSIAPSRFSPISTSEYNVLFKIAKLSFSIPQLQISE